MKRLKLAAALSACAILGMAAPASAASVTFTNLSAAFSNVQGGANVCNTVVAGDAFLGWGGAGCTNPPTGSGYVMDVGGPVVIGVPPSPSNLFVLGNFTHANFGIPAGTEITGVTLTINADVFVDGVSAGNRSFVYLVDHFETPNGNNPCADGGTLGVGVNVNGCADRVRMAFLGISDSFMIGADLYSLEIMGFRVGGQDVTEFWTAETTFNTAGVLARVNLRSEIPAAVPEPGTITLFAAGLAIAGVAARRRARR